MSRGDRSRSGHQRTAQERERDRQERARRRGRQQSAAAGAPHEPPLDPASLLEPPQALQPESEPAPQALAPVAATTPPGAPVEAPPSDPPPSYPPPSEPPPSDPPPSELPPSKPPPSEPPPLEPAPVEPAPVEPPTLESATIEPAASEAWQPLPVAPAPVLSPPMPPPVVLDGPPAASPARRRRRSLLARLAAVIALAAVVVAVVLVLHSREGKHAKTPAPPTVVKVVIPEGKTRAQIAQIASADGIKGSYRVGSRRSPLLVPARYGAPKHTPDLEGFLFPATYDMNAGEPVYRLVEEQLIAFRENFGSTELMRARDLHVTPYQLLIVASMVEREAQVPSDRPKIAAVIYNRLAQHMPLGIDASIYYAVELATGAATYTHELSEAQLHMSSPYNTRTHVGLPPTPISNPGAASIHAAAYPAHVSYLYYVAGADGCGEQVFSDTLAEFEANAAAYKAAVARSGGHPPSCKHR